MARGSELALTLRPINDMIEISARYQMGLPTTDDTAAEADMKNKTIQILAGIFL